MALNFLIITRQPVYPPVGGAPLRNWQNINILKAIGTVSIFEVASPSDSSITKSIPGIDNYQQAVVHSPRPDTVFRYLLHFIQCNLWLLNSSAHPWTHNIYYNKTVATLLSEFIELHKPDVVILEEFWLINYLSVIKKFKCSVILDEHNVEGLLRRDILSQNKKNLSLPGYLLAKLKTNRLLKLESKAIRSVDQTWFCGENDTHLVTKIYGKISNMKVVPNGINVNDYKTIRNNEHEKPNGILENNFILFFPATFGYGPNSEAVEYLIDEILPLLKLKLKNFTVALVGKNPTEKMLKIANDPNLLVTGAVEDMRPYWAAADVVIVPLLQGGGTRLKILEAFASGKPVVSTFKGAEGIDAKHGIEILLTNNANDFVENIIDLQQNPLMRTELANKALELVRNQYSREAISSSIKKYINLLTELKK